MRTLRGYQVSGAERASNPRDKTRKTTCASPSWRLAASCDRSSPRRRSTRWSIGQSVLGVSATLRPFVSRFLFRRSHSASRACLRDPWSASAVRIRPRTATVRLPRSWIEEGPELDPPVAEIEREREVKRERSVTVVEGRSCGREREETQAACDARSSLHRSSLNRG